MFDTSNSILQKVDLSSFIGEECTVWIKRDDLIHPEVSGNKWRKLKYNFQQFDALKTKNMLTFGGAYSNHLLATASACYKAGVPCVGIVRGEELTSASNNVLKRCSELGMKLDFITREEYNLKAEKAYHEELLMKYPETYIVPEGGANYYGMVGCQEIHRELDFKPDAIFLAQGTTTTSCGLLIGTDQKTEVFVVPVLKGFDSIGEMRHLLNHTGLEPEWIAEKLKQVVVLDNYHFGAYGKVTEELSMFIAQVEQQLEIPLDSIYTGKVFYALVDQLKSNPDLRKKDIIFLHTGGVHGLA